MDHLNFFDFSVTPFIAVGTPIGGSCLLSYPFILFYFFLNNYCIKSKDQSSEELVSNSCRPYRSRTWFEISYYAKRHD